MADNKKKSYPLVVVAVFVIILLFVAFYMMGNENSWFSIKQIIGVIVAAAVSGVITVLLLHQQDETQKEMMLSQREGEAARDKDVKIYSNKIAAFSSFNKSVWIDGLDDADRAVDNIENIRKQLYSKVILYLDAEEIRAVNAIIPKERNSGFTRVLSGIIDILNKNAQKNLSAKDKDDSQSEDNRNAEDYKTACQELWESLSTWSSFFDRPLVNEGSESVEETAQVPSRSLKVKAWHFSEWDTSQLDSIERGLNELSLVEYGEYWRTKLVKEVQKGDLVFLFRGSKKYSGVFIAKGWRVFQYDEQRMVEEMVSDGIERVLPEGKSAIKDPSVEAVLEKYDIFGSYKNDDSTSCANVVCERLCYIREGVDNPNTTYRKTISRYYEGYAVKLLEEFRKKETSKETLAKIDALFIS